ncbi:MAG TPA: cytochrome b5 domain-containing protein [Candidatus Limiplasma sp.]|nr:cytochrome b5 domain-containing protein [Candidatus Limiplasma sp.]
MRKKQLIIPLLLLLALTLTGCTTSSTDSDTAVAAETASVTQAAVSQPTETAQPTANPQTDTQSQEVRMTREELAQYDGKNGNPAYIAVDGVIYDVTNVPPWAGGNHNGFTAGQDLTEEIKTVSPHGVSKLNGLTVVGTLAD